MSLFGVSEFGPALFGGDPAGPTGLLFEVDAEVTTTARRFLARGSTDGTGFQIREFMVGTGGLDPFDYRVATAVNPSATALESPILIPLVPLTGTLVVVSGSNQITTSDDLTYELKWGDVFEVTTGTGIQRFTVSSVTITTITTRENSIHTDPVATGILQVDNIGAKNIAKFERPNLNAACCYCVIDSSEAIEPISEIALWAKISCSPYIFESDYTFMAAIGHFPVQCKNSTMRYALRVNVQF